MTQLTQKQFIEQYGEVQVIFTRYYKYSFFFEGEIENKLIRLIVGGSSDDIYRFWIESNKRYKVSELDASFASIQEAGKTIAEFRQ